MRLGVSTHCQPNLARRTTNGCPYGCSEILCQPPNVRLYQAFSRILAKCREGGQTPRFLRVIETSPISTKSNIERIEETKVCIAPHIVSLTLFGGQPMVAPTGEKESVNFRLAFSIKNHFLNPVKKVSTIIHYSFFILHFSFQLITHNP